MRPPTFVASGGSRRELALAFVASALIVSLAMVAVPSTAALFTSDYPAVVTIATGQIFPGDRVSPAFSVTDHSGASASDASSPVAFADDGRSFTTSSWPAAFANGRYLELRFNGPLPGNIALSSASFDLYWASAAGDACMYVEVRDADGALLDTEGDDTSPLACTASSTIGELLTPLPSLTKTDQANGATVRMFVASSGAAATVIDRAVLNVTYNDELYTLYPTDLTDVADGSPWIDHWGLAGP
jgi:hypothetical protein